MVKRLTPKNMRRFGKRGFWIKIIKQPYCLIKTIVLDIIKKDNIADNINKYLNPAIAH
jgi:hypothetical protein